MPEASSDPLGDSWSSPVPLADRRTAGRDARRHVPRSALSRLTTTGRDPLAILDAQNSTRVPDLVPLRTERMAASPFAFFRGTAAIMASDLARDPHSGILVASCGDAHVANFGFYGSPQRTLVFDLNDFDEAAWAPWEWDLKRLVTSIVIAGQATSRDEVAVRDAALAAVRTYARSIEKRTHKSPVDRYFEHFDANASIAALDRASKIALRAAIRESQRRTGVRAARRLTEPGVGGRLTFVETPPTMTHAHPDIEEGVSESLAAYISTANVDIRVLFEQYVIADVARRVVGVGSVGTRCYLAVFQDPAGGGLLLQAKEAGVSVLVEYGGIEQPSALSEHIREYGHGGRVVALQRVLQAVSDPFLGHIKGEHNDYYLRQFHDMKGGIDVETLADTPFRRYAQACAATLARAHGQSAEAPQVAGYIGNGRVVGESLLEWAYAYADVSRGDYEAFVAAHPEAVTTPA